LGWAQREAESVLRAKLKYWGKVLSEEAFETNFWNMIDVHDYLSFYGDFVLSDTLFSSLLSLLFFDLPLTEIVPWTLTWDVELPSIDELLRGILIKLEPIRIEIQYPQLTAPDLTLVLVMEPEAAAAVSETRPRAATVGVTLWGEGYIDPPAVREFLRSTLYAFTKKNLSWAEAKQRVEEAAERLGISQELARDLFERLSAMESLKTGVLTWDYGWWDVNYWGEEGTESVELASWELSPDVREYLHLWDVQGGGWWDASLWDEAYWTDDEPPYSVNPETGEPNLGELRDFVVSNFRTRILTTALAVANYQRPEEMRYALASRRTETYASPYAHRMEIERIAEQVVGSLDPSPSPFRMRLYKTAALEMYGKLYSQHRWGAEMERSMPEDEYREFWIGKWEREGLDRATLERLYDAVRPVVDALGARRVAEGAQLIRRTL